MQKRLLIKKENKFPVAGSLVKPLHFSWIGQKHGLAPAMIYEVRVSNIDQAVECRLRGVFNGVEFEYWEYVDYLTEIKKGK